MEPFLILIPIPFYNFVMVFVSAILLLWFFRSIWRFLRVMQIRNAAISDSLVLIRGIGHSLICFENASQNHMNALIHTRPAKPPAQMNILYLPVVVTSTDIVISNVNKNKLTVDINIWVASKTFIMILSKFKTDQFKQKFDTIKQVALSIVHNISQHADDYGDNVDDLSNIRRNDFTEGLVRHSVCQHISQPLALSPGRHNITLPLYTAVSATRKAITKDSNYAILIIPSNALSTDLELSDNYTSAKTDNGNSLKNATTTATQQQAQTQTKSRPIMDRLNLYSATNKVTSITTNHSAVAPTAVSSHTPRDEQQQQSSSSTAENYNNSQKNYNNSCNNNDDDENDIEMNDSGEMISSAKSLKQPLTPRRRLSSSSTSKTIHMAAVAPVIIGGGGGDKNNYKKQHKSNPIPPPPRYPDIIKLDFMIHVLANPSSTSSSTAATTSAVGASSVSSDISPPTTTENVDGEGAVVPKLPITSTANVATDDPTSSSSTACQEQILCADNGHLFSVNEVYGMKTKHHLPPTIKASSSSSISSSSSSSAPNTGRKNSITAADGSSGNGGGSADDECVVCLTEIKCVLLMPCRHLCVCGTCLQHIDKCPVCRTPFDEYIVLNKHSAMLKAPLCGNSNTSNNNTNNSKNNNDDGTSHKKNN